MTVSTEDQNAHCNSLSSAIFSALVKFLREYAGRRPTRARTTIRDNVVVVMLEQTLTKVEKSLAQKGRRGEGA